MDQYESNEFFYSSEQDRQRLTDEVVSCLEIGTRPPPELNEYFYRKEFGYTHEEYDRIPSKRLDKDMIIMSLINEWQVKSRSK